MRARTAGAALVSLALSLVAPPPGAAQDAAPDRAPDADPRIVVEQPERAFGRMLGDVLVQRLHAPALDGPLALAVPLEEALPSGRIDRWFERLPARSVEDPRGGRALELRYQLVNVPRAGRVVRLPPLTLVLGDGTRVEVPAWPVGIVPLTPGESVGEGDLLALRPDRVPSGTDTGPIRARLRGALLALAAIAFGWLGWWLWRGRRDAARLPFARAARAIGRLAPASRDEDPEAWTALHRALDASAGRTVHAGSLDALVAARPWLAPWRVRIGSFLAASRSRFFAGRAADAAPFAVGALVRELARAERGHAR